jgi:hypothetical protein
MKQIKRVQKKGFVFVEFSYMYAWSDVSMFLWKGWTSLNFIGLPIVVVERAFDQFHTPIAAKVVVSLGEE